jgi:hypothetical protein
MRERRPRSYRGCRRQGALRVAHPGPGSLEGTRRTACSGAQTRKQRCVRTRWWYLSWCGRAQVAARVQRASVEAAEVARYEAYDCRHGARYLPAGGDGAAMDEDEW